ncbi:MAG: hypothetical protein Q9176_007880, partial [Flavoplaca citrina]
MATSISSSLVACRNSFNTLIREMRVSNKEKHEGLSITDWEDERGRLRMWAANIGAHHTAQSSLDFRLRDSTQIQQQIIRLLQNLARQLEDAGTVLTEGEDSDVDSINGSDSGNEESQTEFQQLRSNVAALIGCLFEISILVRKPARHDVRIRSKDIDVAAYKWVDLRHVKDKFPKADDVIASRLGHAITYRRKYLKYRERHAAKLRQGIDHDVDPNQRQRHHYTRCSQSFTSWYEWLYHMKTAHRYHENKSHKCALCGDHQRDQASLGRHVARHLQELALFILPRNEADSDENLSDGKADTSSNRSSLDNGNGSPSSTAPNDPTCDAIAVEDSGYRTANEAKGVDTAAAAPSPVVGGTREIRHHPQSGEEHEENESEDDEEKSVKDEDDPEEDSTNATSKVQLPRKGRTETLKVATPDQKERENELSEYEPSRKQSLHYADDREM